MGVVYPSPYFEKALKRVVYLVIAIENSHTNKSCVIQRVSSCKYPNKSQLLFLFTFRSFNSVLTLTYFPFCSKTNCTCTCSSNPCSQKLGTESKHLKAFYTTCDIHVFKRTVSALLQLSYFPPKESFSVNCVYQIDYTRSMRIPSNATDFNQNKTISMSF